MLPYNLFDQFRELLNGVLDVVHFNIFLESDGMWYDNFNEMIEWLGDDIKDYKDIINNYEEEKLANIIYEYGEERFSRKIARNICIERKEKPITTTKQLVEIIEKSIPKSKQKEGHPAKRTFQAIRIEVNDEIKPLYNTVKDCIDSLRTGGRLCIITFHSLEDRAVKNAYIEAKGKCTCPKDLPYCVCGAKSLGKVVTKKPIVASEEEQLENSRSKSAKLRIFEKT